VKERERECVCVSVCVCNEHKSRFQCSLWYVVIFIFPRYLLKQNKIPKKNHKERRQVTTTERHRKNSRHNCQMTNLNTFIILSILWLPAELLSYWTVNSRYDNVVTSIVPRSAIEIALDFVFEIWTKKIGKNWIASRCFWCLGQYYSMAVFVIVLFSGWWCRG